MKMSEVATGRDNNFNLVRIVASIAVLYSHSFALALGSEETEPFQRFVGTTLGTMAVDLFFITSGFLVTGSLLAKNSLVDFAWARVLRIYPALLVMLLLTVFGLGLCFTTLPTSSYLVDARVHVHWLKNVIFVKGVAFALPGVFESNPYPYAVNGSLWTLPLELAMYALTALLWALVRAGSSFGRRAFQVAILACMAGGFAWHLAVRREAPADTSSIRLFFMFFAGSAFSVLKAHIRLSRALFWSATVALALSAADRRAWYVVYDVVIAYLLFHVAFVPSGKVRAFNRVGDYSYGMYIYAFPVQQSVVAWAPGISVASLFLVSVTITLLLSAASWHLLERPALQLKQACVDSTRTALLRWRSSATGAS
jgi:peptidoglycan/LPS O-acetylase OafA/YrhL